MEEEKSVNKITYSAVLDPKCEGCKHIHEYLAGVDAGPLIRHCTIYYFPQTKWLLSGGKCPMASHVKAEEKAKVHVDPIKASKAKMKGR